VRSPHSAVSNRVSLPASKKEKEESLRSSLPPEFYAWLWHGNTSELYSSSQCPMGILKCL